MQPTDRRTTPDRPIAVSDCFDIAIIGGGALGSAMAWEASSRDLRTVLIERDDFGGATSANSLRILHGGLRYLQTMDLLRARRSVAERSAFLKIAPHLVAPLRCVIPTLPSLTRGRLALAAGLTLNALLTADRNRGLDPQRHLPAGGLLSLDEVTALAPGIPTGGWTGGAGWYDALMLDSERLSLAFVLSARHRGASVWNHAEAKRLRRTGGQQNRIQVMDRLSGDETEIGARVIVDCRGLAMAPDVVAAGGSLTRSRTPCVKAVNLVVDAPPTGCAVGFPSRDGSGNPKAGRMFFALPFHDKLAVGTWYFPGDAAATDAALLPGELDEILDELRRSTDWALDAEAIRAVQVGLLPGTRGPGAAADLPADRPSIFREEDCGEYSGLWRVCTEKWTTVRRLAETALDTIARRESLALRPSISRTQPLFGGALASLAELHAQARSHAPESVDDSVVTRLTTRYGEHAIPILEQIAADPALAERMPGRPDVTHAEVAYSADEEMVGTLPDLVLRRLGLGAGGCPDAGALEFAADVLASRLGWSEADRDANIRSVQGYRSFRMV